MLLRRLNAHLEGLSRAIEAVVQEGLAVRLEPVDLRLEKPSAATFHDSLQALFDAGVCPPEWPPSAFAPAAFLTGTIVCAVRNQMAVVLPRVRSSFPSSTVAYSLASYAVAGC